MACLLIANILYISGIANLHVPSSVHIVDNVQRHSSLWFFSWQTAYVCILFELQSQGRPREQHLTGALEGHPRGRLKRQAKSHTWRPKL